MDIKKENFVILAVFFFLSGILFYINIAPAKKAGTIKVSNPFLFNKINISPKAPLRHDTKKEGPYCSNKKNILSGWGRDPFEYKENKKAPGTAKSYISAIDKDEPLVLSLILLSDTDKTATINNRIFKEGDKVIGEKIVNIQAGGVVLEKNGGLRVLQLRKSPISFLQVEDKD